MHNALAALSLAVVLKLIGYGLAWAGGAFRQNWHLSTWRGEGVEVLFTAGCLYAMLAVGTTAEGLPLGSALVYGLTALSLAALVVYPFALRPLLLLRSRRAVRAPALESTHAGVLAGRRVYLTDAVTANAYAVGFGRGAILLSRDLPTALAPEHLGALLAHEVGHLRLGHLPRLYAATVLAVWTGLLLNVTFGTQVAAAFPAAWAQAIICGGLFYGVLPTLAPALLQRGYERQADRYAAAATSPAAVAEMLIALDELSGGKVARGGLTHPGLAARLGGLYPANCSSQDRAWG